ncbi:MAG: hypothetical protein JSS27_12450 [Planctomycetes bacterium]|nr:hypothetical protein [Planctomycetota bacterium]
MNRLMLILLAALLAAPLGCGSQAAAPTSQAKAVDIETQPLLSVVESAARQNSIFQSYTSGATSLLIRNAYRDVLPATEKPVSRWVGVDVELQSWEPSTSPLELQQIELCDADGLRPLSAPMTIQRLTDLGEPASDDDPIFAGQNRFRCLLMYRVPELPAAVILRTQGSPLNETGLRLQSSTVALPKPDIVPVSWFTRPTSDPRYQSCVALVECHHWSRVAKPGRLKLRCLRNEAGVIAEADAFLEANAQGEPSSPLVAEQPFYVSKRWFLVDFWYPTGAIVVDLIGADQSRAPMPKAMTLELAPGTLEELDATPRFELARHRRDP